MDSDRTAYETIERKYCEDCRWFTFLADRSGTDAARCTYPRPANPLALVLRNPPPEPLRWCDLERQHSIDTKCGPEAKWFEPKPAVQEAAE